MNPTALAEEKSSGTTVLDQIERLGKLRDSGYLTEKEFLELKTRALDGAL